MEYSKRLKGYVDRFVPEVKGAIHTDEVVVKVKKRIGWRWSCIDRVTRFKISETITRRRS